ncbi:MULTISPECIES: nucleotide sugar dehydrogenase [Metasolibacillus]|uniref:nucleotide sugar dehydrogenase n=1 Tax=Metasolibacillus TaxID=2703677 RepID=UPI000A436630|nr:nucleotide sugar dehydrogenase [Metasolibacillus fluoroglycofenilyticus]
MNKEICKEVFTLIEKIKSKKAIIGIVGLGYVGLPLALEVTKNGFSTLCFDKDLTKIHQLQQGSSYITDLQSARIQEAIASQRFIPTSQFELLHQADIIVICVPTPLGEHGNPNITYIIEAVEQIGQHMKENTLIILESTTYPGTTREVVASAIEKHGFTVGKNSFVAYSPERIDPGNRNFNVTNTPKVIGGMTSHCQEMSKLFYEEALQTKVHCVSTPEIAEMEKLLENTFRQVNIALINELSKVCYTMGIDVWEVIDAAATKPYGFMRFAPGPGVGGHCIPVDPKYLLWSGQQHGTTITLIDAADKINESMPKFVVERLASYLQLQNKKLEGARIVVVGAAYKPNINDIRESPALPIIHLLQEQQCEIHIIEPFINTVQGIETEQLTVELIQQADGVLIITNHSSIDYRLIDNHASLIFDTRQTDFSFNNVNYYKL